MPNGYSQRPIPWRTAPGGLVRAIGRWGSASAQHVGGLSLLVGRSAAALLSGRVPLSDILEQCFEMGARATPLVVVTAALAGVVTSQQGGYQFTGSVPLYAIGSVVTSSIVLELGPVMTAFVIIGRVGARITAELGTMKVSEQIDALDSLGRDPVRTLVAPRLLAGVLVTPLLVAIADVTGIYAGMLAARSTLGLGPEEFFYGARLYWHSFDLFYSLMKGLAFGFVVPAVSTHLGLLTHGGASGVGRATTSAVVAMILTVLVLDALFPPLFLS